MHCFSPGLHVALERCGRMVNVPHPASRAACRPQALALQGHSCALEPAQGSLQSFSCARGSCFPAWGLKVLWHSSTGWAGLQSSIRPPEEPWDGGGRGPFADCPPAVLTEEWPNKPSFCRAHLPLMHHPRAKPSGAQHRAKHLPHLHPASPSQPLERAGRACTWLSNLLSRVAALR